ncbi:MAG: AraC family transcriptional regulator [Flavobacterium sp.]|nr:MAG: AraC family transcriptional regulator [Flavobacterium sp.]
MMKKITQALTLFLLCATAYSQHTSTADSLKGRTYTYFQQQFLEWKADTVKATAFAIGWLKKAKQEHNTAEVSLAYKALTYHSTGRKRLDYANQMISAALQTKDDQLKGAAYLSRGIIYYENSQHTKALDDYLTADRYISKTSDQYLAHKVKYQIGFTKFYLGYFDEAVALLRDCVTYFKEENDRAYLNSMHGLALCYNSLGRYDLCSEVNEQGMQEALQLEIPEMVPYFQLSEGINQFSKSRFSAALPLIRTSLPFLQRKGDKPNETVAYFYIANVLWNQRRYDEAIPFLLKVDSNFSEQNYLRPDLLKSYIFLKDYYRRKGDWESEVYFIERLLKADSIIKKDYAYLTTKINTIYNAKELITEKEQAQERTKIVSATAGIIIAALVAISILLYFRHRKIKKRYKDFKLLMDRDPSTVAAARSGTSYLESSLDLNPEVAETLLRKLESFEKNRRYLEKDMTLVKLATMLNTNQKYVTKIIAHYRGKKTIEYISDLKIDYIVVKLKNESRYRKYTNKALGEEAGFGSTQIFTKTFKSRTGMSPTWFISEINKAAKVPEAL